MNAREAAAACGVNERTVRRAIKAGRLTAAKNGRGFDIDIAAARVLFMPDGGFDDLRGLATDLETGDVLLHHDERGVSERITPRLIEFLRAHGLEDRRSAA